jgi:hypothetical protein
MNQLFLPQREGGFLAVFELKTISTLVVNNKLKHLL